MAERDEAARKARAARLREQIARLKAPRGRSGEAEPEGAPPPKNPRDFIERRMREEQEGEHPDGPPD